VDSILTAHRPVNKPMTPDVRLHSNSAMRSRGHALASISSPMTAAILFCEIAFQSFDPMVPNCTTLSHLLLHIVAHLLPPFPRSSMHEKTSHLSAVPFANPAFSSFRRGVGLTRYYVIASPSRAPEAEFSHVPTLFPPALTDDQSSFANWSWNRSGELTVSELSTI
jgi:hypothetical protein